MKKAQGSNVGRVINLTPAEAKSLNDHEKRLIKKKLDIAGITVAILQHEQMRLTMIGELQQDEQAYGAAATNLAKVHGIDPEKKDEKWELDSPPTCFSNSRRVPS